LLLPLFTKNRMLSLLYYAIPILLEVLLVIHVIKTGRNTIWIWLIIFLPMAGGIAYAIVELIPELMRSRTLTATGRSMKRALDPEAQLRRLQDEAQVTQNVASNQRYAEELLRHNRFEEAAGIYRKILTGLYEHDPDLMLGLARAQFGGGDASAARATLDEAIQRNPNFRSPEGHLLYARALEAEGNTEKALTEYQVLSTSFPGAEGPARGITQRGEGSSGAGAHRAGALPKGTTRLAGQRAAPGVGPLAAARQLLGDAVDIPAPQQYLAGCNTDDFAVRK
jgi:hypothetical protein